MTYVEEVDDLQPPDPGLERAGLVVPAGPRARWPAWGA